MTKLFLLGRIASKRNKALNFSGLYFCNVFLDVWTQSILNVSKQRRPGGLDAQSFSFGQGGAVGIERAKP